MTTTLHESEIETFYRLLTEGIPVTYRKNGYPCGDLVWLIDFENPDNNYFLLVNQFTVAVPHEKAMTVKEKVGFFQAVKSRLIKFDTTGSKKSDEEIETAIRQVIDESLVSEQVIDIFSAAGIKKPDISILSEDFLNEIKNMEHKNVALKVLKKLLNDEIKGRPKKNLIQSRSLMEMLENSIKKYHKKNSYCRRSN